MSRHNTPDSLSKERQMLTEKVLKNLETGAIWQPEWATPGTPSSGVTGKSYKGMNALLLTMISAERGYADNRWVTFNQMKAKGWRFKEDGSGGTVAKGKAVPIEFYELRDKNTKNTFDKHVLDPLAPGEKVEYLNTFVYPVRRTYYVYNASLVDGMPNIKRKEFTEKEETQLAEKLLNYWDENESKIIYGGTEAFYRRSTDEINVPDRNMFKSANDFYSTVFHELAHSTGHESRLNRKQAGRYGEEDYAVEELRAEISALFLQMELGVKLTDGSIRNNAGYIGAWAKEIKKDPDYLFHAIADADRISDYAIAKAKIKDSNEQLTNRAVPKSNLTESDKTILNRLEKGAYGKEFIELYSGKKKYLFAKNTENAIIRRIALYAKTSEDVMRIFKCSAQYDEKRASLYPDMVKNALELKENILSSSANVHKECKYVFGQTIEKENERK